MYVKSRSNFIFFLRLIDCYCPCRKLHVDRRVSTVDRGAGAAAAVRSGRTLLDFFKQKRREGVAGVDGQ